MARDDGPITEDEADEMIEAARKGIGVPEEKAARDQHRELKR